MARYLFPGLLLAALAEFATIIWVAQRLGIISTLALLVIAGYVGISVIKHAGLSLFETIRQPPRDLQFASNAAAGRFLGLVAGVLLIVPGFISDVLALLLLVPPLQAALARRLGRKVEVHTARWTDTGSPRHNQLVIDGEAVEIKTPPDQP